MVAPRLCGVWIAAWISSAFGGNLPAQAETSAPKLVPAPAVVKFPFADDVERTWVGPEFYGTRLQDWRVREGRAECVESSAARPVRVLHLLTTRVDRPTRPLRLAVRTGPVADGDGDAVTTACRGFLVGCGNSSIDYRLSALAHHRPAADGGIVAAVDNSGRVVFRDFETNVERGSWGVAGKLATGEFDELAATGNPAGPEPEGTIFDLVLEAIPNEDEAGSWRLELEAFEPDSDRAVSRAVLESVPVAWVDGGFGLVSHHGPNASGGGYWFDNWQLEGEDLVTELDRQFGPILGAQYTLSRGTLKLTAQLPPLGVGEVTSATLWLKPDPEGDWEQVAESSDELNSANGFTVPFRVENYRHSDRDVRYRVSCEFGSSPASFEGVIRREPDGDEVMLAAFTGNKHFTGGIRWNHDGVWFPHLDIVRHVEHHDPDLLFFSGDQIYEGDLTGVQRRPAEAAKLDYLDKWYRWVWAFRDLVRERPTVCIPDDHDVYHGNIWGAGGRAAKRQDDGGYTMPAEFVKMVEATQTSHLPDPFDPTPVEQGIGVYYTSLNFGGVSFAILEDRKFKSSPTEMVPEGDCVNGWFRNPEFDAAQSADVEGAVLLGDRQLQFLDAWGEDWTGDVWMKAVLSQTIFANVATLPTEAAGGGVLPGLTMFAPGEYAPDDKRAADADSNGWPQSGRDAAVAAMRKAFAVHVAGDQHLASMTQYGVENWGDAGFALCVPSIANTWPRRWFPPRAEGFDRAADAPDYTGKFRDGFGNKVEVFAVANPVQSGVEPRALHDRQPGYGIVVFRRSTREVTFECWPRSVDPSAEGARQYLGWPKTVQQLDNYGRPAAAWLPEIEVLSVAEPVIKVIEDATGETVYTVRSTSSKFRPKVFSAGSYTIEVTDAVSERRRVLRGVRSRARSDSGRIQIRM